jgi:hypothetical protein
MSNPKWMEKAGLTRSARKDILDEAEKWWQNNRHKVRKGINEVGFAPKVRAGTIGPTFITKPSPERDLDDGILEGREWDDLSIDEQSRIMFNYFSIVWLPAHPEVKLERRVQ